MLWLIDHAWRCLTWQSQYGTRFSLASSASAHDAASASAFALACALCCGCCLHEGCCCWDAACKSDKDCPLPIVQQSDGKSGGKTAGDAASSSKVQALEAENKKLKKSKLLVSVSC